MAEDEAAAGAPEAPAEPPTRRRRATAGAESESPEKKAQEAQKALEWFMEDDAESAEPETTTFRLEVGRGKTIEWTVKPLHSEIIKRIREASMTGNREQRRQGTATLNEPAMNLRIVATATFEPSFDSLLEIARKKGVPMSGDTTDAVMHVIAHRFRDRPLVVDNLAQEILAASGGDPEYVQKVEEGKD